MAWQVKAADLMKFQQDNVRNPLSLEKKQKAVSRLKELGVTHVPVSTPYDTPAGAPDVNIQTKEWVDTIKAAGLKTWHRHSWLSDEGFYDTPHNNGDTRIEDTVKWIKDNKNFFQFGDIFTPKPEPQNCRVIGLNWGDTNTARFKNVAGFNDWLRNMSNACLQAFQDNGIVGIKTGYWGFDGFVVCGFGNPDWQGKSFLEKATVDIMEDGIAVDHYPYAVPNTTMADFIALFKQVWPDKKLIIGETGAKGVDEILNKAQINGIFTTLKNEPIVMGVNYWPAVGGIDGPLMNDSLEPVLGYETVKSYFKDSGTPPPPPPPPDPDPIPPTPTPTEYPIHCDGSTTAFKIVTNKGNLWKFTGGKWTKIVLPNFTT